MIRWADRLILATIVILFVALGITYSVVTPIFETPDEYHHYFYIQHLINENTLPVQEPVVHQPWAQEGSQPPLYYLLASQLIQQLDRYVVRIDTRDAPALLWLNQHANMGVPLWPANKNRIVHLPRENWPYQRTVLAIHVARWFSLALALGTVLVTYLIGRDLLGNRRTIVLGATGLVAFTPQFVFISAAVTNDNLVIFLSTIALWLLLRHLQRRATRFTTLALGIVVGMAALAKLSGLFLLPLTMLILLAIGWRTRDWRDALLRMVAVLALVLGIASWWYWRNWQLYGDFTGLNAMLRIVGQRLPPPTLSQLANEFEGLRISYWGLFGWFNVPMDAWIYRALDVIALIALGGLLFGFARRRQRDWPSELWLLALPAAWLTIVLAALVRWTSLTPGTQGRLLFPAISGGALLFMLGWSQWLRRPWRKFWVGALLGALLVLTAIAPFRWIAPAYAKPPTISATDIPADARRAPIDHGAQIRFLGAKVEQPVAHPGEIVWVTIYWETLRQFEKDYTIYLRALGPRGQFAGQTNTWPGLGSLPTRALRPGSIIEDRYPLRIEPTTSTPLLVNLDLGFFDETTREELKIVNANGEETTNSAGRLQIVAWPNNIEKPKQTLSATFGPSAEMNETGAARLLGYDLEPTNLKANASVTLTLHWQNMTPLTGDFHVFVHVVHESGTKVAQVDQQPREGDWPTWAWLPQQNFTDTYKFTLPSNAPAGAYTIYAGLYRLNDFARLPVTSSSQSTLENAVAITTFSLKPAK